MTGLDVDNDVIIEIFCVITNGNLDVLDEEGWGAVIHQSQERMDQMVRSARLLFHIYYLKHTNGQHDVSQSALC